MGQADSAGELLADFAGYDGSCRCSNTNAHRREITVGCDCLMRQKADMCIVKTIIQHAQA